jgi:DHA2 family methylenomycin A resistance protein-like MFS transporter
VLVGLSLGYFLVLLDSTIVTVALPSIGSHLGGGVSSLQWVADAYLVTFAALLLSAGALADRLGGRRVFLAGLWAFAALSAACALAGSIGTLIVLRALLGVAGALLVPSSLALIAGSFPEPGERARALGLWAALSGSGLVAGPVVGGLLTEAFGWPAVFLVAVPVAGVSAVLVTRSPARSPLDRGRRVDVRGQAVAVIALAALSFALIESGDSGWRSARVLAALGVFVVAAGAFVLAERGARAPMLPPRLFRDRTFGAGLLAGTLANFGLSGVLFVLSFLFQQGRGLSAGLAGLAFLPLTVPTAVNPIFTGRLVARIGARGPAVAGFVLMVAGTLIQALAGGVPASIAGLLLLGTGVSFAIPALVTAVVAAAPGDLMGIGAGALNAARQTGAVLGVAVLGTIMATGATTTAGGRLALLVAAGTLTAGGIVAAVALDRR